VDEKSTPCRIGIHGVFGSLKEHGDRIGLRCSQKRDFELKRFGGIELFVSDPMSLNGADSLVRNADGDSFYLFDGQFSASERFFHTLIKSPTSELRRHIDALLDDDHADEEIDAGLFVAGRIDERRLVLSTDPLSQYPVYYFRSRERFIISNVLRQVAAVLASSGLSVTPSLLPCLEGTVLGGVLGDSTHIVDIKRLPYEHVIVADPHLRFRRRRTSSRALSYEETITFGRSALARHVRAVAAAVAEPRLIATDLTGGSHSRLVLSLLLDSPLRTEIKACCFARYPHADANVAALLMSKYNLPIANLPLVVEADCGASPQNIGRRVVEANAAFSGGGRQLRPPLATVAFQNFVHFTGSFGEIGGATPAVDFISATEREGYSAARAVDVMLARRRSGPLQFVTKEGIDVVRRNAIAALTTLEEEGVPREQLPAEFYLRGRCRSHFGLPNYLDNKGKITPDPLASAWLVEARRMLPRRLHYKNKVVLDLILRGSSKELAFIPMAEKVWDPSVVPSAELESFRQITPVTACTPPLSSHTGRWSRERFCTLVLCDHACLTLLCARSYKRCTQLRVHAPRAHPI
jgi:hypothetical protein